MFDRTRIEQNYPGFGPTSTIDVLQFATGIFFILHNSTGCTKNCGFITKHLGDNTIPQSEFEGLTASRNSTSASIVSLSY